MNRDTKSFPVLDTDKYSILTEYAKLTEEVQEFIGSPDKENLIEEFYDVIQVLVNIIDKNNLLNELPKGLDLHIEKLKKRGWNIKRWL